MEGYAARRIIMYQHLEDPYFKQHFRMNKACFERLYTVIHQYKVESGLMIRDRTETADSTLVGLWMLFNKDTFRSSAVNLGFSQSTQHFLYEQFLTIVCAVGQCYIAWPDETERRRIARYYWRNFGFPGIVGCLDGTLVPITAPKEQKEHYVDRHRNYSINVMIVSDHKRLIRDIFIGQPGSLHDSRVFRRSNLAKCLYARNDMLLPHEHLVGDQGYVLTEKVLIPYRNDGHLTNDQRHYNTLLSQCRSTVERLNGLLKCRMQRIGTRLFCKSIFRVNMHIAASAVIHNFILLGGREMRGMRFDGDPPIVDTYAAIQADMPNGIQKRERIRAQLAARLADFDD